MNKNNSLSFEIKNNLAYVGFGATAEQSMPILDQQTLQELEQVIGEIAKKKKGEVSGVIFFGHNKRAFLAGADIKLISSMKTESQATQASEWLQRLFNNIEDLPIPTVACVHGICLGGGCELVLACDEILASDHPSTQLGLPEVQLGVLPGAGGTYRMPRRVGLPTALQLILTGKKVTAKKALRMKLVDGVYPMERLLDMALKRIQKKARTKRSFKERLSRWSSDNFLSRKVIFSKARENVLKKTKGHYQAPLKILDVMEEGQSKGRNAYLAMEAMAFGELCVGTQGQNLQHIFFLMDGSKKYGGPKAAEEAKVLPIAQGAVLGAGTMGGGLAWLFAQNDQFPIMKDLNNEALQLGLQQSSKNFRGALKRKRITLGQYQRRQRSITPTLDYQGFRSVDLVIEAAPENMQLKKNIFAELETHVREDCLITSNTSSLSVSEMAKALKRPQRFAGLHFFNPVNRMPLVEIITHHQVAPETIQALYQWVLKVKKTPLIVGDGPGFLVNRILMPYMNMGAQLLETGVDALSIETACTGFGMPMGPFRLMDEVGLDVGGKVAKIIGDALGPRMAVSRLLEKVVEAGLLGRKGGLGFYHYDNKGAQGEWNRQIEDFLPNQKRSLDETALQMQIFLPMINEAAHILQEGIVSSAKEVDLGLIFGLGFPPFRGGLLRYADQEGIDRIVAAMKDFAQELPDYYSVAPYLQKLADEKKRFYPL